MEDSSQEIRIKSRDKWACKLCGDKFVNITSCKFRSGYGDDDYISLCKPCLDMAIDNPSHYVKIFEQKLLRNKIVLVGDCHGNFSKLDSVLSAEEPFDYFISVGDVGSLDDVTLQNITIIDKWKPKGFFIRGNHDDVQFFNPLSITQNIRGASVAGVNGILRSRTFSSDKTKDISFKEIMYLSHQKDIDILVTHQPPTGMFNGIGEAVLEELLNYTVPKIYIFGHIHKYKLKFHLQTFMISLPLINKGYAVAYFRGKDLINLEVIFKKGKKTIRI